MTHASFPPARSAPACLPCGLIRSLACLGLCFFLCACGGGGFSSGPDTSGELARRLRARAVSGPVLSDGSLAGEIDGASAENRARDAALESESLARALLARGFYDAALAHMELAVAEGVDNVRLRCLKGRCLAARGDTETAAAVFGAARDRFPDAACALSGLAMISFRRGDAAAAVRLYETARQMAPASALIRNNLAVSLLSLRRTGEAIRQLRKALSLAPRFRRAWNNLGLALALSGREEEALAAFRAGGGERSAGENLACIRRLRAGAGMGYGPLLRPAAEMNPGPDQEAGLKINQEINQKTDQKPGMKGAPHERSEEVRPVSAP